MDRNNLHTKTCKRRLQRLVWNKWQYDIVVIARHWSSLLVTLFVIPLNKMCYYIIVCNVSFRTSGARI